MAEIAKKKRQPVRVGDVVISPDGSVEEIARPFATHPGAPPLLRLSDAEHDAPETRIPPPYVAAKFVDVGFPTYLPATPSQRSALEATKDFCRQVHSGQAPMLALIGSTGTGKSHLLYSAAKALHATGHRVFSRPWYLLADHLRWGGPSPFNPNHRLDSHELREAIIREPVFMIDEVRPTAGTDFDDTELAKIVCHAWDNSCAILITTNVSPLRDVVGPATASRFTQVTITGPDHRQA